MGFYRKVPVVIESRQFDPEADYDEACAVAKWCGGLPVDAGMIIPTLEGDHLAQCGDWIIKGVRGEFYPCKRDIFEETYEEVAA